MCFIIGSLLVGLAFFVYRKINTPKEHKLHEPNWKKDKVYLVQVPVVPEVRVEYLFTVILAATL